MRAIRGLIDALNKVETEPRVNYWREKSLACAFMCDELDSLVASNRRAQINAYAAEAWASTIGGTVVQKRNLQLFATSYLFLMHGIREWQWA